MQEPIRTADLYRLAKAMPATADMPDLLLELDQVARAAGVSVGSIAPGAPTQGTGFSVLPLSLTFTGDFYSLTDLLYRLQRLVDVRHGDLDARGRLFSVSSVALTPTGTGRTADRDGDRERVRVRHGPRRLRRRSDRHDVDRHDVDRHDHDVHAERRLAARKEGDMARKTGADAAKAKAAKQKKIVIALAVVLVLALAYAYHTMQSLGGGPGGAARPGHGDRSHDHDDRPRPPPFRARLRRHPRLRLPPASRSLPRRRSSSTR